jgi:hypothetical protein
MRRAWEILRVGLVATTVAFCASAGIEDGMRAFTGAATAGQRVASVMQLLYGALSVAVLLAMALRPRWVAALLLGWGAALTVTGALATVVWGEQGWGVAAVAGVSIAAVVALILWAWRAHERASARRESLTAGR